MIYIQALELINTAIEHGILKEEKGKVVVYRNQSSVNKEGFYLDDKDAVAKELMKSEEGQQMLLEALKEKGMDFVPKDYSWLSGSES